VLKLTAPGVPDLYQGTELWNLSMVDPTIARAVDYATRGQLLENGWRLLMIAALSCYVVTWITGKTAASKLALTHLILDLRRTHANLFANGSYEPCVAQGD